MSGKKLMIVDDSPAIAEVIREGLVKAGYEVFVAHNGFEALRDLETVAPDLILTDINMPKLDGLKLCQAIQNRLETRSIPFIFFSSSYDEKTVKKGKEIGAKYFIAKPFTIEAILECVKEALAGPDPGANSCP
ncbi:MAG TPA: response regulator [bacterium]|nr:response regulator [bacterium]